MKFTPDQQKVIDTRDANILVSAAAGSGKTTVLVERVLGLIAEGANIDEMLIVTFTRAASADMRAKLNRKLTEACNAEQLERLDYASISTLHSFCSDIIRSNFELADCDPAFRVLDDTRAAMLEEEALTQTLNAFYENGFRDARSTAQIREMVAKLAKYLSERPDPEQWFQNALRLIDSDGSEWLKPLYAQERDAFEEVLGVAKFTYCQYDTPNTPSELIEMFLKDIERIETVTNADDAAIGNLIKGFKFDKKPNCKKDWDKELNEEISKARDVYKGLAAKEQDKLKTLDLAQSLTDIKADRELFIALFEMARDMEDRLWELKKQAGGMTFGDMEVRALKVLSNETAREHIKERYKYIFIDEYQDTSDMQEAIVSRITKERNLFMVGDAKQSIYRFRGAAPQLFLDKYESYRAGGDNELIVLHQNFRSKRAIIDCVNAIFGRVMRGGNSEIDYDDDAKLYTCESNDVDSPRAELIVVNRTPSPDEEPDEDGNNDEAELSDADDFKNAELEGYAIAQRIKQLRTEDPDLQYRDICIISRARKEVHVNLEHALTDSGIPCFCESTRSVFDAFEVVTLMAVLRLLISGRNDMYLLTVLRSPIIGMRTPELADLRIKNPKSTLWEAVRASAAESEACLKLVHLIERYRMLKRALPLSRLMREILEETGLFAFVGALPGGARRQANLNMICTLADKFEKDTGGTLAQFVEYAEHLKERSDRGEAHELSENDNVVRIMTSHGSKGLEFKVVFAALLGRRMQSNDKSSGMYLDDELGCALDHYDEELGTRRRDNVAIKAYKARKAARDLAEELRVLYVTLTRAQERLIMTGTVKDAEKQESKWEIARMQPGVYSTALDIVIGTARSTQNLIDVTIKDAAQLDITPRTEREKTASERLTEALEAENTEPDPAVEAMLWEYPDKLLPYAPAKLAATGVMREYTGGRELPELVTAPAFLKEDKRYNPTGRGTALHIALRNLDYAALEKAPVLTEAIASQLNAMTEKGILTREEREMVHPVTLADFFTSDVGKRMRASNEVHREWSFSYRCETARVLPGYPGEGEIYVQGCMDLCFMEEGGWVLVDYKTDRTDDREALMEKYRPQLMIYSEALEKITGTKVKEALICLIASGDVLHPLLEE